jgi:hypothetical protein
VRAKKICTTHGMQKFPQILQDLLLLI